MAEITGVRIADRITGWTVKKISKTTCGILMSGQLPGNTGASFASLYVVGGDDISMMFDAGAINQSPDGVAIILDALSQIGFSGRLIYASDFDHVAARDFEED